MRKTLSILVVAAAVTVLGACGTSSGSDEATTTTTEVKVVPVATWADTFCGSFSTWLADIEKASNTVGDDVDQGDVDAAKTAIADLFGTASTATQTLISDMKADGAPDITDGDQLVADLIEKFEAFDAAANDAKTEAGSLPDGDVDEFKAAATELTDQFQDEISTVADSFTEIDKNYPSAELSKELTSACDF
jgi:hypothetical protein